MGLRSLGALLVGFTMVLSGVAGAGTTAGIQFGAYVPPSPESGTQALANLELAMGDKTLDIVHWYQAWGDGQHGTFHAEWFNAIGPRTALLSWEPWTPQGGT